MAQQPVRRGARLVGVDVARGLAVLGMFVAHLGLERSTDLLSTTGWFWIADGRSSALFATLAGVGVAFMTQKAYRTGDATGFRTQRIRIAKRAGVLLVLGWVLVLLGTPVAVILGAYAALFVLVLPFLRLRPAALLGVAAVVVAVMPTLVLVTRTVLLGSTDHEDYNEIGRFTISVPVLAELWSGYYPALSWLTYVLVGLAIGRMGLASARVQALLLVAGAAVAAVGYGAGIALEDTVGAAVRPFVTIAPHADTTFEIVGNVGVALAVTGLCLLLTTRVAAVRVLLTPVSATGSMSLTVYALQIVVIAILGEAAVRNPASNLPLLLLVLGTFVFATVWQRTLGQGPLERVLSATTRARPPQPPPDGPRGGHTPAVPMAPPDRAVGPPPAAPAGWPAGGPPPAPGQGRPPQQGPSSPPAPPPPR